MQRDRWPFTPTCLSEIIDDERLAVIEAGCAERLGRAITIIDGSPTQEQLGRIDSPNRRQNFEAFCHLLRDETRVKGGNAACEACDQRMTRALLQRQEPTAYQKFQCHLGLTDAAHLIKVAEQPVAVVFGGQFQPSQGHTFVQERVQQLGTGRFAYIQLLDEQVKPELLRHSTTLPPMPADFKQRLAREAEHIQRIAEAEHQRIKHQWEHGFLDSLRSFDGFDAVNDLNQIRYQTERLLAQVQSFCRCHYLVFFANIQQGDMVLAPLAQVGLSITMGKQLPHFNWRKAGLPLDKVQLQQWSPERINTTALKGIRGDQRIHLQDLRFVQPVTLGNIYLGVLVFGPFAEPLSIESERHFLSEIGRLIGHLVLTELEILNLHQQKKQWESTAKLLTHQVRTALTPITAQIGTAKLLLQRQPNEQTSKLISSSLKGAHELCLRLGKSVAETVEAHVLLLEPEDMKFEDYPLSVLVSNCADAFTQEAERRQRVLIVDESVEELPQAEVDIARLAIALSNLIDNAIKYSFPNTKIVVRAGQQGSSNLELTNAIIEIQDDGDEIALEQRERIFEEGARGLTGARLRRIPGTGLGLWETRAVIEAHRGSISVRCEPTATYFRQMRAYRVIFRIKIPLRQTA